MLNLYYHLSSHRERSLILSRSKIPGVSHATSAPPPLRHIHHRKHWRHHPSDGPARRGLAPIWMRHEDKQAGRIVVYPYLDQHLPPSIVVRPSQIGRPGRMHNVRVRGFRVKFRALVKLSRTIRSRFTLWSVDDIYSSDFICLFLFHPNWTAFMLSIGSIILQISITHSHKLECWRVLVLPLLEWRYVVYSNA